MDTADYAFADENSHRGVQLLDKMMANAGVTDPEERAAIFQLLHAAGFRIVSARGGDEEATVDAPTG